MKSNKSGAPEVWISSWVEADNAGNWQEKGITLHWQLPEDVYGMMVEVDDVEWGPFTDLERTLNIPYPDFGRTLNGEPVRVRLRYLEYGKELELKILDRPDNITLILSDVILLGSGGGNGQTYCPVEKYSTPKTASFIDPYWEIVYSDKYSTGRYRALHLTITPPNHPAVSCAIRPGAGSSEITDELYTTEVCGNTMQGVFSEVNMEDQTVAEVEAGDTKITISTYRNPDTDSMIVRVECPADFIIDALLHDEQTL